jgi:hypothetical protein
LKISRPPLDLTSFFEGDARAGTKEKTRLKKACEYICMTCHLHLLVPSTKEKRRQTRNCWLKMTPRPVFKNIVIQQLLMILSRFLMSSEHIMNETKPHMHLILSNFTLQHPTKQGITMVMMRNHLTQICNLIHLWMITYPSPRQNVTHKRHTWGKCLI